MKFAIPLLGALFATGVLAQASYPTRPITLVVSAATGGGLDGAARMVAKGLQQSLGQPVVVENQGGADGLIAAQRVAGAAADGHTMLLSIPSLLLLKHNVKDLGADPAAALIPVAEIARTPAAIAVQTTLGVKTFKELVAYCNASPKPCSWGTGQQLSYLSGKRIFALSGLKETLHIPYKGTGPVLNDLLGGHITVGMTSIAAPLPHHLSGAVRILAVNAEKRLAQVPDVPTFREAGIDVPPRGSWYGVFVPKGTPAAVVEKVAKAIEALEQDPAANAALRALGAEPVFGNSREFAASVREEQVYLDELVRQYPLADGKK